MRISILGVGRLGGSFAIGLSRAGLDVRELIVRGGRDISNVAALMAAPPRIVAFKDLKELDTDVLIISVLDPLIESIAEDLVGRFAARTVVIHTSGSLSSEVLDDLRGDGHAVGSLHPLISFSDPLLGAERLAGGYYCIEGDDDAVEAARKIVETVSGNSFTIDKDKKSLYHASAVMACGHVVALLDVAFEMLAECGLSSEEAKSVLMPLIRGTIKNLEGQSVADALTGPFARGDVENFERNLAAIEKDGLGLARRLYIELGERSLEIAEKQGADPERIAALKARIRLAK